MLHTLSMPESQLPLPHFPTLTPQRYEIPPRTLGGPSLFPQSMHIHVHAHTHTHKHVYSPGLNPQMEHTGNDRITAQDLV